MKRSRICSWSVGVTMLMCLLAGKGVAAQDVTLDNQEQDKQAILGIQRCFMELMNRTQNEARNEETKEKSPGEENSELRLPRSVLPIHYDIVLLPRITEEDNFTVNGSVLITVRVISDTSSITLHSRNLTIPQWGVQVVRDKVGQPEAVKVNGLRHKQDLDFLYIDLEESLKEGHTYKIGLHFEGVLDDSLEGFYRSSYTDKNGQKQWLGATQFERISARKAFPCFDEPELKATFSVTIGRPQHLTAISNMPLNKTEPISNMDGWVWDHFDKSAVMSTYLVAFVVSQFIHVKSNNTETKAEFKIWARDSAEDQLAYAAEVGPRALAFYEQYLDLPFPLPKVDMAAIPDFKPGAMENWGLVTYKETTLLYGKQHNVLRKAAVAKTICHELTHQWFGNIVTMKWWSNIWLNEGFATYFAFIGTDHLEPEWNYLEEVADNYNKIFTGDALNSSIPVVQSVILSPVTYNIYEKAGLLLRMMQGFLGEEAFISGLRRYLKKYKYGNTEQDDLWESLTEAAHKYEVLREDMTVKQIMDNWTKQTGYPLLTVTRDYQHSTADVKQERYITDSSPPSMVAWWVPVTYLGGDRPSITPSREWLKPESHEQSQQLPAPPRKHWLLYNANMSSLYRVNYDAENWDLLIQALNSPKYTDIPTLNRYQLILDSLDLAWNNKISYHIPIGILSYLSHEMSTIPWRAADSGLKSVDSMLRRTAAYGPYKVFMRRVLQAAFIANGGLYNTSVINPESLQGLKHQELISDWSCRMGVPEARDEAGKLFNSWAQQGAGKPNPIPAYLRDTVYCAGVAAGGPQEWKTVLERYTAEKNEEEKKNLLKSFSCTTDSSLLAGMLEMCLQNNSAIRPQDVGDLFSSTSSTEEGFYPAKTFLYQRTDDIYKNSPSLLNSFITAIANQIKDKVEYMEFVSWARLPKPKESAKTIEEALKTIHSNIKWIDRNMSILMVELTRPIKQLQ